MEHQLCLNFRNESGKYNARTFQVGSYVVQQLDPGEKEKPGSVSWYTTTVKLDMEVKREIERVPGSKPQRLRSTG